VGARQAPQLLHLLERQGARVGRREQQAAVACGDDEEVGHGFEQRARSGMSTGCCAESARTSVRAPGSSRENARRQRRLGLNPLVEILVGGAATVEVQHPAERGEGEASAPEYQAVSRPRSVCMSRLHDVADPAHRVNQLGFAPWSIFLRSRVITTSTMFVPGSKW